MGGKNRSYLRLYVISLTVATPDLLDPKSATHNTKPLLSFSAKSVALSPREESQVRGKPYRFTDKGSHWWGFGAFAHLNTVWLNTWSVAGGCHRDEEKNCDSHLSSGGAVPGDWSSSVQISGAATWKVQRFLHLSFSMVLFVLKCKKVGVIVCSPCWFNAAA